MEDTRIATPGPGSPSGPPAGTSVAPLVLFDGECGLCHSSVRFILKRDRRQELRFASLQSDLGRQVLLERGMDPTELSTMFYLDEEGRVTARSTAALRVAADHLRFPWRLAGIFRIVPTFLRDAAYRVVSRNRVRWFGKADACSLPSPAESERFVS